MKLLFDHNLAPRLSKDLERIFPDSAHTRELGLERAADEAIWELAASQGFAIITKDDDFRQRSFLYGAPPKIVWVRLGNCRTSEIEALLRERAAQILAFGDDPEASLLVLDRPASAAATNSE